jgi:4-methylaminobutanoate oxidase (formaldehyde-forming)
MSADTPLAHGGELILCDGKPVGEITSAAFGHTLGAIVALGYVSIDGQDILSRRFELDIAGDRVPVRASLKAPYDPAGARLKG